MGGLKSTQKPSIESNFMPTSRIYSESYWAIENYGELSKNDVQLWCLKKKKGNVNTTRVNSYEKQLIRNTTFMESWVKNSPKQ